MKLGFTGVGSGQALASGVITPLMGMLGGGVPFFARANTAKQLGNN